jgi:hypothetical protein
MMKGKFAKKFGPFLVLGLIVGVVLVASPPVPVSSEDCCCGPVGKEDGDCASTDRKWRSDFLDQAPYESMDQPNPPLCCECDGYCLHSDGSSARHGMLSGTRWICGSANISGRVQGVWYQCGPSRAIANTILEGHQCLNVDGDYVWVPISACGGHGEPACGGEECDQGLQRCGDNRCWYCCGDGSSNGICGTDWNGHPCSREPGSPTYDADCP